MDEKKLIGAIESILFAIGRGVSVEYIKSLIEKTYKENVSQKDIVDALKKIKEFYNGSYGLKVYESNELWFLSSKEEFVNVIANLTDEVDLTKSVLETLAVIAWKAPVLQSEIIELRNVKAYEHIEILEKRGFIKCEKFGNTKLIKLTDKFFDYFDLEGSANLKELFSQRLKEFEEKIKQKKEKSKKNENIENINETQESKQQEQNEINNNQNLQTSENTQKQVPNENKIINQKNEEKNIENTRIDKKLESTIESILNRKNEDKQNKQMLAKNQNQNNIQNNQNRKLTFNQVLENNIEKEKNSSSELISNNSNNTIESKNQNKNEDITKKIEVDNSKTTIKTNKKADLFLNKKSNNTIDSYENNDDALQNKIIKNFKELYSEDDDNEEE